MKRIFMITCLLLGILTWAFAQSTGPAKTEAEYQAKYQKRITKEYLANIYIPADLADAFIQLNKLTDRESRQKFLSISEDVAAKRLFYGFGRWMIINWSFYEGSRFSHYLKELGLSHPEDMARFVMITYHRNLQRSPLNVKPLIDGLVEARRAAWLENVSKGEVLQEHSRKRDSTELKSNG